MPVWAQGYTQPRHPPPPGTILDSASFRSQIVRDGFEVNDREEDFLVFGRDAYLGRDWQRSE